MDGKDFLSDLPAPLANGGKIIIKINKRLENMRVLFYTAAAMAATIASLSQAIRLESDPEQFATDEYEFSQLDVLSEQITGQQNNNAKVVQPAAPAQD